MIVSAKTLLAELLPFCMLSCPRNHRMIFSLMRTFWIHIYWLPLQHKSKVTCSMQIFYIFYIHAVTMHTRRCMHNCFRFGCRVVLRVVAWLRRAYSTMQRHLMTMLLSAVYLPIRPSLLFSLDPLNSSIHSTTRSFCLHPVWPAGIKCNRN